MKILITSVDAIINDLTDEAYPGIINALDTFKSLNEANEVVVVSIHAERLRGIPERFNPSQVNGHTRRVNLISKILHDNPQFTYSDVVILGSKKDDLYLAANERVPLLTANYTKIDTFITEKYGIAIRDGQALTDFCERFLGIQNPWYYQLKVDDETTLYSLIKAGDFQPANMATLFNHFQDCLKHSDHTNLELFKAYFLMSCYSQSTIDEFREVDFWGIYPSSGTSLNHDLEYFKELARTSFNGKPKRRASISDENRQLLIRTSAVDKRHFKLRQDRLIDGCDEQLKTIIVNPIYREQLKNATVCIIDDFTTFGTSCETTRLLMKQAGVKKLLFLTMGKFGQEYYHYDYTVSGDPFVGIYPSRISGPTLVNGSTINSSATKQALDSLKTLL